MHGQQNIKICSQQYQPVFASSCKLPDIFLTLTKYESLWQIFMFDADPSRGSQVSICGETDRGTYVTKALLATLRRRKNNAFTHWKQYRCDFKTQQKRLAKKCKGITKIQDYS